MITHKLSAAFAGRVFFAAAVLLTACDGQPTAPVVGAEAPATFARNPAVLQQQLAALRAATARYHDIDAAIQDGFVPISGCVSHPQLGGMGIHYARPDRMGDADYIATEPEMLLYVPAPDGSMKLLGVEYWILEDAWNAAGRSGRPMFIEHPFDHSPAGHGMPARYSLHVWSWHPNPSGLFAPFNPRVTCPQPVGGRTPDMEDGK
jgi:hypothetical protein